MAPSEDDLQIIYDLHGKYYNHLLYIGLRLGWNKEDCKDLINQMFADFAEQVNHLKSIQNKKAYLTVAFKRRLIDAFRIHKKNDRVKHALQQDETFEYGADQKMELDQHHNQLSKRIKAIYQTLPPRCQKIIYLKFYEGLSTEEIAEKTGLSVRSVYNNLSEGLRLFRAELQPADVLGVTASFGLLFWFFGFQKIIENTW